MQIGEEGDASPKMIVDMTTLDWSINGKEDPYGFKHGWKASEMQRPKITNVFIPYFVTINSVLNGRAVNYMSEGNCAPKKVYNLKSGGAFTNEAIIIASSILLTLAAVVTGVICYLTRRKKKKEYLES